MNKKRKVTKRIAVWFMCLAMVLTTINLPAFTNEVKAEGTTTVQAPSVTAFATVDDLKDASKFALYKESADSKAVAQKVNFCSRKTWYIAGADTDGSLVLICDPTTWLGIRAFLAEGNYNIATHINNSQYDGKDVFANHYGASDIRGYLNGEALNLFSTAEKGMMVEPTIYTYDIKNECAYSTSDKLYLAYGNYLDMYITVGANDSSELNGDIKIGLKGSNSPAGSPYASTDIAAFWLRAPNLNYNESVCSVSLGHGVSFDDVYEELGVVPAFNMNLSSVLFASAAIAASSDATFSDAMTFRVVGTGKITSSAIYDNSGIKVTKGGDGEYIYIQYKDETGDKVWSKAITDDMGISTECVGIDSFANCKIWIEKKDIQENTTYAVMATSGETGITGHTYLADTKNINQHKCSGCGLTEMHDLVNWTKVDSEKHSGICKGCGVVVQDHNYVVSSDDSSKHTCFDCGATEIHTYIYTSDNNATCGEDGTKTGKCKYCDATDTKIDEGSATGNHDFDEEGICKECEYECAHKDVSGSTFVAGQCSVCNYNCVANGHVKNTNKKSNKNAIEHEFTCSVCGETGTENHHFESISVTSHRCADCGAIDGHDTKGKNGSCSICGYSEEGSVLVVTKFATPQQLKNANNFALYQENADSKAVAQKVNFGYRKTWYIAGADTDGSLVLICDPAHPLGTSAFLANGKYNGSTQLNNSQYDSKDVFANHYGASDIRNNLKSLYGADNKSMFTDAEQGLMVNTPVYTRDSKNSNTSYLTSDKLYLAHGTSYNAYIIVGMNSSTDLDAGIKIGIKGNGSSGSPFVDSSNGAFWLRSPYGNYYGYCALQASLGNRVLEHDGTFCVSDDLPVVPAFNMDISSVLFASAATTASADATFTDAMTFRMDGTDRVTSSAVVHAGKINITKGNGDNEYLYVQGTDGETDWVYSKEITKDEIVTEENIRSSKNLSDIDLAKCIIWIETEDDNVTYAKPFSIIGNHSFVSSNEDSSKHICSICGLIESHTFTDYMSDGNSTCGADGTKTAKCDNCDATDTIADPDSATGNHDFSVEGICKICNCECTHQNAEGWTVEDGKCTSCGVEIGYPVDDDDKPVVVNKVPDQLWVTGIKQNLIYTGAKVEQPTMKVYWKNKLLVLNQDYTVKYLNNIKAGTATVVITGKGNYAGTIKETYPIAQIDIGNAKAFDEEITIAANGRAQKPTTTFTIEAGGKTVTLKNGTDYTYTYPVIKDKGEYKVTITGKGNYKETKTIKVIVVDKGVAVTKLTVKKIPNQTYRDENNDGKGDQIVPDVVVTYGKKTLKKGTDYTVEVADGANTDIGVGTVTIVGNSENGYYGKRNIAFNIVGTPITKATVEGLVAETYTGNAINPAGYKLYIKATKTTGQIDLTENKDYRVSVDKNVNAGTATVTFTGINGYSGVLKKTFKINKASMTDERISIKLIDAAQYQKNGAKPAITVIDGSKVLKENVDYTVKYTNNNALHDLSNEVKKPTVTITGKGNYVGTKSANFAIIGSSLSKDDIIITATDIVATNRANTCRPVIKLTDNGVALRAGTDYETAVEYTYVNATKVKQIVNRVETEVKYAEGAKVDAADIIPAGTEIKATVKGKGLYADSAEVNFRYVAANIASAKVVIPNFVYTKKAITLDENRIQVTMVVKKKAETLKFGEDFEIIGYKNNVDRGTAKVTIRGLGNYGGTKEVGFKIVSKTLNHTVRLHNNDGSGKDVVREINIPSGTMLPVNTFKVAGKKFAGWNTEADGSGKAYSDREAIVRNYLSMLIFGDTLDLYAQWE